MKRPVPIPQKMKHLPIDPKWNLPIPWFVAWIDGKPHFPVVDGAKWMRAVTHDLCWICGKSLTNNPVFVIGPMCGVNRVSAEPPCHLCCAVYAAQACPFLSTPGMKRMDVSGLGAVEAAGFGLKRNPGCCGVSITTSYEIFNAHNGPLIRIGEPIHVNWFAEGRSATREEIQASITSGLPSLMEMAEQDGPEAVAELKQLTLALNKWLPRL